MPEEREKPKHLCVGGQLVGQMVDYEIAQANNYTQFNCAYRTAKSQWEKQRLKKAGHVLVPSMVYIHRSVFENYNG